MDVLANLDKPVMPCKLIDTLHEMSSLSLKCAGHPRYKIKKMNQLCISAENMLMRRRQIFPLILLAMTNANKHSRQSRNGGSPRSVKMGMFTAVFAS